MIEERILSYLDTIHTAASDAVTFVRETSYEEFLKDTKTQLAVVMCFVRIGESTRKIEVRSSEFIARHPEFPWHEMRGLRNRGVHGYESLRFDVVWSTATHSLPRLLKALEGLAPDWRALPPESQ